jgi:hypothetical protein
VTRRQCEKCPWKIGVDPRDIPNGYSEEMHAGLADTIAAPGRIAFGGTMRIMACHESRIGRELPCVGWLYNQLGDGNNIPLRIAVAQGRIDGDVEVVGPQHATFEDTLPR